MSSELFIFVGTVITALISTLGAIFVATHQKPSKELLDIIAELRLNLTAQKEDNATLKNENKQCREDSDKAKVAADRARSAVMYLIGEVKHDYPSAAKIAHEILIGVTIRDVDV